MTPKAIRAMGTTGPTTVAMEKEGDGGDEGGGDEGDGGGEGGGDGGGVGGDLGGAGGLRLLVHMYTAWPRPPDALE